MTAFFFSFRKLAAIISLSCALLIGGMPAVSLAAKDRPLAIRLTYEFDYQDQHYKSSFLTVITPQVVPEDLGGSHETWSPKRTGFTVPLKDGSGLYLNNEFPGSFEDLYLKGHVEIRNVRWVWIDNISAPKQVELYNSDKPLDKNNGVNGKSIDVQEPKLRIDLLADTFIEQANSEDNSDSVSNLVLATSFYGGWPKLHGQLFSFLSVDQPDNEYISALRNLKGWDDLSGGCRALKTDGSVDMSSLPKRNGEDAVQWTRRYVRYDGDVWYLDQGLDIGKELELLYPIGEPPLVDKTEITSAIFYTKGLQKIIHKVASGAAVCVLPPTILQKGHFIVDFGGRALYMVEQGISWVLMRP